MTRDQWQNLNGLWNYAILPKGSYFPDAFDGKILKLAEPGFTDGKLLPEIRSPALKL